MLRACERNIFLNIFLSSLKYIYALFPPLNIPFKFHVNIDQTKSALLRKTLKGMFILLKKKLKALLNKFSEVAF